MTKLNRNDLLKVLVNLKPALSTQDYLPILSHYCFTEDGYIFAYNDVMGISFPSNLGIDFEGALPGDKLMRIVSSFSGEQIEFSARKNEVTIKSGRSKIKLPMMDSDAFVWEEVNLKGASVLSVTDDFINGVKQCKISISQDTLHPAHMGIQLSAEDDEAFLYSTNNHTLSRYILDEYDGDDLDVPVVLPAAFCNALVSLCPKMDDPTMHVGDGFVRIEDSNGALIFSKLLFQGEGADFANILDKYYSLESEKSFPITQSFVSALERAVVILGNSPKRNTEGELDGNILKLSTVLDKGRAHDVVCFGKGSKSSNKNNKIKEISMQTDFILRGCSVADEIIFGDSVILMRKGDNFLHLVAQCG